MTAMGVRQHLQVLEKLGEVRFEDRRQSVGRPARVWGVTEKANKKFPEGYSDLTLDLLQSVRDTFGVEGMEKLIADRTKRQTQIYKDRLPEGETTLAKRVALLTKLRSEDGYLAEWTRHRGGTMILIENHCPICVAAEACQGICNGELELFQAFLGDDVAIERVEHILDGSRRCVYRINHS